MMEFFWRRLRRGDRGFTLIELLIVVAIIAILAAILIPNFLRSRAQAQVASSKGNMKNIGTALESYFVQNNTYPTADQAQGTTLGGGLKTLQDDGFLNAVPKDPCTGDFYGYTGEETTYTLVILVTDTPCDGLVTTITYTPATGLVTSGP